MTFELSPQEPKPAKQAKKSSAGDATIGFGIILLISGVIGFFVDGMTLAGFLGPVAIVALLVAALGVLTPLPFFAYRRLVALVAGLVLLFVAIPFVMSLRTPTEVENDEKRVATREQERRGSYDDVEANPETYLTYAEYRSDVRAGNISGVIKNSAPYPVQNVKLKCRAVAETGKTTDRETVTVYRTIPANGTASFSVGIGYVDQQAVQISCLMTDADIANGQAVG